MKFYHREQELELLNQTYEQSQLMAKMLVITGRRRVGKTLLALQHVEGKKYLYLFVSKKSENLLCEEYLNQIKSTFIDAPIFGEINTFKGIFSLLMTIAKAQAFILVIDEFQEFMSINPSVYSDIQHVWDLNKSTSKLQLIFLGSIYSLMHKIFEHAHEPLFGRADYLIHLKAFNPKEMFYILKDYQQDTPEVLLNYYLYTGGMPRYMDIFLTQNIFSENAMIDFMLSGMSPFLDEGKNVLIEEFGKDYNVYFSILELIATGYTTRADLESNLNRDVGGYLDRLENTYAVISKFKPFDAKPNSRKQQYKIQDLFLRFWFRFIYRYRSAVETGNFNYIKQILFRDLKTYQGKILESLFYDLFALSQQYNILGVYWEKDGSNEIDLIGLNQLNKVLDIAEIKLNKNKISLKQLEEKAQNIAQRYAKYRIHYLALSLEDIVRYV